MIDSIVKSLLVIVGLPIALIMILVLMSGVVCLAIIMAPFDREYALNFLKAGYKFFVRDAFK